MQGIANRLEAPSAIRSDLGAIFVSMELSRSIWLITSLSPGGGEKMSKHSVPAGDIGALLARFSETKQKALARTGRSFPIIVIQEAGLDGFWIYRALRVKELKAMSSIRPRLRHRVDGVERRPTVSMARRCFVRCWRTSAVNLECARWSGANAQTRGQPPSLPRAQGADQRTRPACQPGQRIAVLAGGLRVRATTSRSAAAA